MIAQPRSRSRFFARPLSPCPCPSCLPQADPKFFLRYTNIYVDWPSVNEDMCEKAISPHDCRLRDLSYAAPLYVDVKYTLGNGQVKNKTGVMLGRIPIMLRSSRCWLRGKTMTELEDVKECPYDPGE